MLQSVYTEEGQELPLKQAAHGNRGFVCAIEGRPEEVCKVMGARHRGDARRQKLQCLIERAPQLRLRAPGLVLPGQLVYDDQGQWAGFTMPQVEGPVLEAVAHDPAVSCSTRVALAQGAARAVLQAHLAKVMVGDLGLANMLYDGRAGVMVLDPDSFQVRDDVRRKVYAVGEARERSPEMTQVPAGKPLVVTPAGESFLLATALFQMLFWGVHPLDTGESDVDSTAEHVRCIREKRFPYADAAQRGLFPLESYGEDLARLFRATFRQTAQPPVAVYLNAMNALAKAGFLTCPGCGMQYSLLAAACPNCGRGKPASRSGRGKGGLHGAHGTCRCGKAGRA